MRFLLDTCVLSEVVKSQPDARVMRWFKARQPQELFTSAITMGELRRGVHKLPQSKRRTDLEAWLQNLEAAFDGRVLPFDADVARHWASMTVSAESRGKPMSAFDSFIAATAIAHGCHLVTRNTRDFAHAGVDWLDPWAG